VNHSPGRRPQSAWLLFRGCPACVIHSVNNARPCETGGTIIPPEYVPIAVKLALNFALLITIGMVGLGYVIGNKQAEQLGEQIDKFGTTLVQRMSETAREPLLANDQLNLELIVNTLTEDANIDGAAIFSDELNLVAQAGFIPDDISSLDAYAGSGDIPKQIYWQSGGGTSSSGTFVSLLTSIKFHDITVGHLLMSFDHSVMTEAILDTFTVPR